MNEKRIEFSILVTILIGIPCTIYMGMFAKDILLILFPNASKGTEMLLVPGMIFTIEPMINEGSPDFFVDEDNGWTVYTEDDGLSAQVEYMVLITEDGCEVLTK